MRSKSRLLCLIVALCGAFQGCAAEVPGEEAEVPTEERRELALTADPSLRNVAWARSTAEVGEPSAALTGKYVVADVDGDRRDDVVFVAASGTSLRLRTRFVTASGTWRSRETLFADDSAASSGALVAGDFNGDRRADVALISTALASTTIRTFFSNGDGSFRKSATTIAEPSSAFANPLVADLNCDRRSDLVFSGFEGPRLTLVARARLSNGDGTYTTRTHSGSDASSSVRGPMRAGDVDGDGCADLATLLFARPESLSVRLRRGKSDGTVVTETIPLASPASAHERGLDLADLDGDGRSELLLVGNRQVTLASYAGGGRVFEEAPAPVEMPSTSFATFYGDSDGDSIKDLLSTSVVSGRVSLAVRRFGRRLMASSTSATLTSATSHPMVAGDFDADGKVELLAFQTSGERTTAVRFQLAPDTRLADLVTAYRAGHADTYDAIADELIGEARRSTPSQCITGLTRVAMEATARGMEGLESIALTYHDCASVGSETNANIATRHAAALTALRAIPATTTFQLQKSQRLALHDGNDVRDLRPDAAGVLLDELLDLGDRGPEFDLQRLQYRTTAGLDLCSLPLLYNANGQVATQELLRVAECISFGRPGGTALPTQFCEMTAMGGAMPPVDMSNPNVVTDPMLPTVVTRVGERLTMRVGVNDANRLRSLLEAMCGSGDPGDLTDPISGFSTDDCVPDRTAETMSYVALAEDMRNCFGVERGGGNPYTQAVGRQETTFSDRAKILGGVIGVSGAGYALYASIACTALEPCGAVAAGVFAVAGLGLALVAEIHEQLTEPDTVSAPIVTEDGAIVVETWTPPPNAADGAIETRVTKAFNDGSVYQKHERRNGSYDEKSMKPDGSGWSVEWQNNNDRTGRRRAKTFGAGGTVLSDETTDWQFDEAKGKWVPVVGGDSIDYPEPDLDNEACQDLLTLGMLGGSREIDWAGLFGRGLTPSRRFYSNPVPDSIDETTLAMLGDLSCLDATVGGVAHRNPDSCPPILCEQGTDPNGACGCSVGVYEAVPADSLACLSSRCAEQGLYHGEEVNGQCACESDAPSSTIDCGFPVDVTIAGCEDEGVVGGDGVPR
jgi:hypothetical protein